MSRGRPFQPGNRFGRGRPKGSRNKRSQSALQLLDQHGPAILNKARVKALNGDGPMLRTLIGHLLSQPKEQPVKIGPLAMGTPDEPAQTFEAVMKKLGAGVITVSEAGQISELMEKRRRILETQDLAERVRALEISQPNPPPPPDPNAPL